PALDREPLGMFGVHRTPRPREVPRVDDRQGRNHPMEDSGGRSGDHGRGNAPVMHGSGLLLGSRGGQTLPALLASRRKDLAAALGLHAGAETVGLLAVAIARTIRALHGS